ncbi:hypothetical protein TBLA_0B04540 [Henningerozyma blattae CBS 6284]|uniref:tRNA-splicing endonuclease subunit Sen54 N-terminal domain-containing protein n=1 Tax=Henningerozyma blattae (strain ATCC 34711 / CBS 6284 / DSM 70876 / NBRC 10599 / NRRL Y-10934 / UCD 77-7) TaxID=1071380 RepID=I2GYT8_HENB6|nr:hypothetical protein TBLA_0B04540 [Tetrapisispora blattae CBS 6284]CCH59290.1 hypothetical protein TBLA_0B04540 [Tetrapisispora blattae CBS 6284]
MSTLDKDYENDPTKDALDDDEIDDDELTQDWSKIAALSKKNPNYTIPKRGEKDAVIDGTNAQELLLNNARNEMFEALENSVRGTMIKSQVKAYYLPLQHEAIVPHPKGNFLQSMGKADKQGRVFLKFHEFLYLAERGTITPYQTFCIQDPDSLEEQTIELQLSIQDLYSFFKSQDESDNFLVFAYLKRLGFIVNLTDSNDCDTTSFFPPPKKSILSNILNIYNTIRSIFTFHKLSLFNAFFYSKWNFLFNRYTTSGQIYVGLKKLIPFFKAPHTRYDLLSLNSQHKLSSDTSHKKQKLSNINFKPLKITFDVWKPQSNYKKKVPGLPDYQVVVFNKNDPHQRFPTYLEMRKIFDSLDYKFEYLSEITDDLSWNKYSYTNGMLRTAYLSSIKAKAQQQRSSQNPNNPKSKKKKNSRPTSQFVLQNRRLKNGYRSFLLCVIDSGIISFVKISETDFGSEDVWYVPPKNIKKYNK